jgi:hypothetical protein
MRPHVGRANPPRPSLVREGEEGGLWEGEEGAPLIRGDGGFIGWSLRGGHRSKKSLASGGWIARNSGRGEYPSGSADRP